jgi:hypothetical protein
MFGASVPMFDFGPARPTGRPAPPRAPPVPRASSAGADPLGSKVEAGSTEIGYIVAKAFAKMHDYKGFCLALVVNGQLVRPCKPLRFGDAAPFWSPAEVDQLDPGMPVQITAAPGSSDTSYPHAFDDVEVQSGTLDRVPRLKRKSLAELLSAMCQPSLETVWPPEVWQERSEAGANSIRDGAHVPSLTVIRGEIVRYGTPEHPDKQRAQIVTECGIKMSAKVVLTLPPSPSPNPPSPTVLSLPSLRRLLSG